MDPGIGFDFLVVEGPGDKGTSLDKILPSNILAVFCFVEDFFANRNRPFDLGPDNFPGQQIEVKVHNVEVITSIDGTHERDSLMPVVHELMSVTTEDSINCVRG